MGRPFTEAESEDIMKRNLNLKFDLKRSVGRPILGWIDGVVEDMRILRMRNWSVPPEIEININKIFRIRQDEHGYILMILFCWRKMYNREF